MPCSCSSLSPHRLRCYDPGADPPPAHIPSVGPFSLILARLPVPDGLPCLNSDGLTVICGHIASRVGSLTLSCQGYYHPSTGSIRADWSVLSGTGDLEGCQGEGGWAAVVPLEEEERRFERLHGVEVQLELSFPGAATPAGEGGYPLKRVASRQKREQ